MKTTLNITLLLLVFVAFGCQKQVNSVVVSNGDELKEAISNAVAGDQIIMKNGVWKNVEIRFTGEGTAQAPITLKAETPGKVMISGQSDLKFGGNYLTVDGLFFKDGFTPSEAVIQFKIKSDHPATHCRVTNCAIIDYNQMQRDRADHWVEFWGRHNELDHCYIAGKTNDGPTIRIKLNGNPSISNYHQIVHNHFGPRPRKGGPHGETIQIGDSQSSMSPSYVNVANNLFERCNGEVEIISSKSNFNEFRNNVFYKCEGSLVTRHGNYCIIDANYFIGDENSDVMGGIRIVNTGHWVINNYFYNLKGENFRSPLAIMNGIPKSPLNRYNQVTDVTVAFNTWVNCTSPWQFGVGSNISQKDVLPASEIRSATPIRTLVANNIIYNEKGDKQPYVEHDNIKGITFKSNLIQNQDVGFKALPGLEPVSLHMSPVNDYLLAPAENSLSKVPYNGFEFETITNDLYGNSRVKTNLIGAVSAYKVKDPLILSYSKYGTTWYDANVKSPVGKTHKVSTTDELIGKIANANAGDIIQLAPGTYEINRTIPMLKKLTITTDNGKSKPVLYFTGNEGTPLFEMHPKSDLTLESVEIKGQHSQIAFASLKQGMSNLYNVKVKDADIHDFDFVLKAYKYSMSDEITFVNCAIYDCKNGISLAEETQDNGDYNVEFLTIKHCEFKNIPQNVIDYYRGGYDESTIGGNLLVKNCSFTNCGKKEESGILINSRGIINVNLANNTFKNNPVKLVALMWGAKNNRYSKNTILNSGKIVVEENLKLKLMY